MSETRRPLPTGASYSITVRIHAEPSASVVGELATAVGAAGGLLTAIDVSESRADRITVDVTCSATNADHAAEIVDAMRAVEGVTVHRVSDRTFLLHLGGKIAVSPKVALRTRDDLSMAYTPGVGRVSMALAEHPEDVAKLTVKGNSVAVVTDGSAVLGLGNIGPGAALPVMEGKAALFKRFADIDAWPICLDTQDADEIVQVVRAISPGLRRDQPRGHLRAALLRDRAAAARDPRHPRLPRRPARHGHRGDGGADERAALRVQAAGRRPHRRGRRGSGRHGDRDPAAGRGRPARAGVGPRGHPGAGRRPAESLEARSGAADESGRGHRHPARRAAGRGRVHRRQRPRACSRRAWIDEMADAPVVFALANPDPEVDVDAAMQRTAVLATGTQRLPEPDQQRARLPRGVPRPARCPGQSGDDVDAALSGRRRWRAASPTSSSTPPTSCRRCSTRPCLLPWPPRCSRRPSGRPAEQAAGPAATSRTTRRRPREPNRGVTSRLPTHRPRSGRRGGTGDACEANGRRGGTAGHHGDGGGMLPGPAVRARSGSAGSVRRRRQGRPRRGRAGGRPPRRCRQPRPGVAPSRAAVVPSRAAGSVRSESSPTLVGSSKIRTAELTVDVAGSRNVAAKADAAGAIALRSGGDIDSDDRSGGSVGAGDAAATGAVRTRCASHARSPCDGWAPPVSQQLSTRDVTGQVADVQSRVTSAQTAILRLRQLYATATRVVGRDHHRAGAVRPGGRPGGPAGPAAQPGRTDVARDRHAVYLRTARVTPAPPRTDDRSGFLGGLASGWDAFTRAAAGLATGLGAALPFLVLLFVLGAAGLWGRRRFGRVRAAGGGAGAGGPAPEPSS